MPEKDSFAARLKTLRLAAGLSQNGLAEKSGVAVSTIRQFEYGLREPAYGTLVKLAGGLGLSLSAFEPEAKPKPARATPPAVDTEAKRRHGKRRLDVKKRK